MDTVTTTRPELTSSRIPVGGFSVPLPSGANLRPPSGTMVLIDLDVRVARHLGQPYRAWAVGSGYHVVSESDNEIGWSLVVDRAADPRRDGDVLVFTCFYEPHAALCIQVDGESVEDGSLPE